jgi:hypothetical protein
VTQPQYILNRLPIGMVLLDGECRVVGYSRMAASVLGEAKLRDSLGKTIQSIHSPQSGSKIDWLLRRAREEGSSGFASMLINVPDTVLQLRMLQLEGARGVSGYCLILYDITELTSHPPQPVGSGDESGRLLFKLPISTAGRIALLDVDQVSALEAQGHSTQVHAGSSRFVCTMSLSHLEARLPRDRFVRVHRSYIVNLARANAVRRRDDQFVISMEDDSECEIPVSRHNVPELRRRLGV